jgi:hypothetical protein
LATAAGAWGLALGTTFSLLRLLLLDLSMLLEGWNPCLTWSLITSIGASTFEGMTDDFYVLLIYTCCGDFEAETLFFLWGIWSTSITLLL